MKLYPIPTTNELNIDLGSNTTLFSWVIYDMTGIELMRKNVSRPSANVESISISELKNGHYLLLTNTSTGISRNIFEKQ
ncbi:MAG: T9SS type A sorting domain-containing protein [Bacteroidetes bacterium]|nr:T9SS type A sorting domain-containing protein [Bacteroidota bacterium]